MLKDLQKRIVWEQLKHALPDVQRIKVSKLAEAQAVSEMWGYAMESLRIAPWQMNELLKRWEA